MIDETDPTLLLTRARAYHDGILTAVASGFLSIEQDVLPLLLDCAALFRETDVECLTREQADAIVYHVTALEALARKVGELLQNYQAILALTRPDEPE